MIVAPAGDPVRGDNTSAYVLLAALLFGGAVFVLNGMRLKRRDLEYLRQARRPTQRRTSQRGSSLIGMSSSADRDITGEVFLPN